jgi:hypothetical protein
MRLRSLGWSLAFMAAGVALAAGWVGGRWSATARLGAGMALATLGFLLAAIPLSVWWLRRTTRASDYEGGCPVGANCGCGHFNFRPRPACRQCGAPTVYA